MPDHVASQRSLVAHLRTLTEEQLTQRLAARPELTLQPAPDNLPELADRILDPRSVNAVLTALTLPELQVGETVAALGDGCTAADLAALLDRPSDDSALAAALARLSVYTLTWPLGNGLAGDHLRAAWPRPLQLGPTATELLADLSITELRRLAKTLGGPGGRAKPEIVAALTAWIGDRDRVRELVAQAPPSVQRRLTALAWETPPAFGIYYGTQQREPLPWAVERGLVLQARWGAAYQMPREVALAIRGPKYHAPFDPRPPAPPTVRVPVDAVAREAAAAAGTALGAVIALAEAIRTKPVALLKNGGLGVRELRRLASSAQLDAETTRLTIEIITAGGLVQSSGGGLTLSDEYDRYAATDPADRLLTLVRAWLGMPASPLTPAVPDAPTEPALYWDPEEEAMLTAVRSSVLRTLVAAVPEGHAGTTEALAEQLPWHRPIVAGFPGDDLGRYATGLWREAHTLGLLAHGAPTALCRALVAGDLEAARRVAGSMTPQVRATVLLQADLTAVVTGIPAADLQSLLDSAADPESRSGAWTWRFSTSTVRRALDSGIDPKDLRDRLVTASQNGQLPQPLAYLIDDVSRRHGHVRIVSVGCCLCSDDEVLLSEVLATKALRALSLHRLAPTVLASGKTAAEALAALRAAGYAPVEKQLDGTPVLQIATRRPAPPPPSEFTHNPHGLADPAQLARTLLRSDAPAVGNSRG